VQNIVDKTKKAFGKNTEDSERREFENSVELQAEHNKYGVDSNEFPEINTEETSSGFKEVEAHKIEEYFLGEKINQEYKIQYPTFDDVTSNNNKN